MNEEKINRLKKVKYISLIVILALILIDIGIYFSYISNPNYIFSTVINKAATEAKNIFTTSPTANLKNYSLTSNISIKVNNINDNPELSAFYDKLNKLNTNISIKQDTTTQTALYELTSKLNEESLFEGKYLIKDATGYYFIKDYLKTYINSGNNNYFETLSNTTTQDNMLYLYDAFIKYSIASLKKDYFKEKKEKINTEQGTKNLNKISLELDNKKIIEILNSVISKLKKDEKANSILTNMNEDFSKYKLKKDTNIISSDDKITINIYTSLLQCKPVKFELLVNSSNIENYESKITYEKVADKGIVYIIKNNNVQNILNIEKKTATNYNIEILDNKNKSIGNIEFNKDKNNTNLSVYSTSQENRFELRYSSKKNNNSTEVNSTITFKLTSGEINLADFDININTNISDDVSITEDVTTAVLKNSLTAEEQANLQTIILNILYKLLM